MEFKIKEKRTEKNLTQEELANKSNVSRNLIARLESGELKSCSTTTLEKLAEALDTTVNNLFFDE